MRLPEFRINSLFLFSLIGVTLAGLMNLYSAAGSREMVFARQVAATLAGAALCAVLAYTDYRILRKFSGFLFVTGALVLLLTWKFGREVKATKSWIDVGLFSIQPSELFKCVFLLHLSAYLARIQQGNQATTLAGGLVWPAVLLAVPVGLILLQKDAGTAAVYIPIFFVLLFMANLHFTFIAMSLSVGLVAGFRVCFRIFSQMSGPSENAILLALAKPVSGVIFGAGIVFGLVILAVRLRASHFRGGGFIKIALFIWVILFAGLWGGDRFYKALKPHQKTRIATFFMPNVDPQGSGYQAMQAQIAVGSGGIFGKGYLRGTQKGLGFLPEESTDFAFSVLAEEWGFAGSTLLLILYGCLIGSGIRIAGHATELYGCLLAVGAAGFFFVHVVIVMAMNLGAFPVVGIPMPFLSYGGSAQVANLAMAGLILSVYRHRRLLAA